MPQQTQTKRKTETQNPTVTAKNVTGRKDGMQKPTEKRDCNVLKLKHYDPYRTRQQNKAKDVTKAVWKP